MKEAFRLLNKSIIRVETPDIDFEDQELIEGEVTHLCQLTALLTTVVVLWPSTGEAEEDMISEVNGISGVNGINRGVEMDEGDVDKPVQPVSPKKPVSTRKIRVTYEEYKSISNLLILHLRQIEETSIGKRETEKMVVM